MEHESKLGRLEVTTPPLPSPRGDPSWCSLLSCDNRFPGGTLVAHLQPLPSSSCGPWSFYPSVRWGPSSAQKAQRPPFPWRNTRRPDGRCILQGQTHRLLGFILCHTLPHSCFNHEAFRAVSSSTSGLLQSLGLHLAFPSVSRYPLDLQYHLLPIFAPVISSGQPGRTTLFNTAD